MSELFTIETPPSSSLPMSTNSFDEPNRFFQTKKRMKLLEQISNDKVDQFDSTSGDDMNTPLRRSLGNTKLKTRQDVRRFRKFLKRTYNIISTSLIDIDPDTMRTYLIDYLTSIRTRKDLKYDPETLRSYYLSIQRYLKDCNYPFCLRSSPQFGQCRDLIIQMRKEKTRVKSNDLTSVQKNGIVKKISTSISGKPSNRIHSTEITPSSTCLDLLPSSSLPPRKRQEMKYFLESTSPCDSFFFTELPRISPSPPLTILSANAYSLLIEFLSSSENRSSSFEQLLDQSSACGNKQRLMLTTLCQQWTGDIRIIHANLRPEISSFLPHILLINILSSTC